MALFIEVTMEPDGLWHAHAPSMPEAQGHGQSPEEARDLARMAAAQVLADSAEVTERDGWFFVHCTDLDMSNQGETLEEAKEALKEASSCIFLTTKLVYASPRGRLPQVHETGPFGF